MQEEKEVVRDSKQDGSRLECPGCGNDKNFNFCEDEKGSFIVCNKCCYREKVKFETF